jgi:hypothetical protein
MHSRLLFTFFVILLSCGIGISVSAEEKSPYQTIEWVDLLPEEDLNALLNPPESLLNIEDSSEEDQISNQLLNALSLAGDSRYQQALSSTNIRSEYNNQKVRIPGFIVPVSLNNTQQVTAFFVVPYYGACIHMPPPPPNQIIFSQFTAGIKIDNIYEPYWVEGTLHTTLTENEMATSAYALTVDKMVLYEE